MDKPARNIGKKTVQLCVFLLLVNLPFLTIISIIGPEVFFDSFDHPESYICVKSTKIKTNANHEGYLVIQKYSHQDFSLSEGDEILFLKDNGDLQWQQVYAIGKKAGLERYYMMDSSENINEEPIYRYQILGKVIRIVDNNMWNAFSLKIWDMSINNLNAAALFTDK